MPAYIPHAKAWGLGGRIDKLDKALMYLMAKSDLVFNEETGHYELTDQGIENGGFGIE